MQQEEFNSHFGSELIEVSNCSSQYYIKLTDSNLQKSDLLG